MTSASLSLLSYPLTHSINIMCSLSLPLSLPPSLSLFLFITSVLHFQSTSPYHNSHLHLSPSPSLSLFLSRPQLLFRHFLRLRCVERKAVSLWQSLQMVSRCSTHTQHVSHTHNPSALSSPSWLACVRMCHVMVHLMRTLLYYYGNDCVEVGT